LPHLPGLHINEGGLALLFNIYKKILPDCGGYLNDNGKLDVAKCQAFFVELSELERQEFDNHSGDVSFMKSKQKKMPTPKNSLHLSDKQKLLFRDVKDFMETPRADGVCEFNWSLMPAKDRKFLLDLLDSLGLSKDLRTEDEGDTFLEVLWDDDDDEDDEESQIARLRVVKRYEQALDTAPVESKESEYDHQYSEWKKDYYKGKLEFTKDYNESVDEIAYKYVEGLQWVLLYYYHGVPSWEWFYPYHYAPRISDLKNIKDLEFNFAKGKPFRPFDQLMAVLPPLSKQHVPICLQDLMTDIHSPIIDFYPMTFELDMNGKKASWEAIVKIPFIDEKRLLKAIDTKIKGLTKEEVQRNQKGDQKELRFLDNEKVYKSDLTEFPDFKCFCEQVKFEYKPRNNVRVNRLCDGARLGNLMASGFPSMGHLNHTWSLGHHGVQVFNQASQ
jgi:5'-3' exoribonuclease 1